VLVVTHMFDLAHGSYRESLDSALFLCAAGERRGAALQATDGDGCRPAMARTRMSGCSAGRSSPGTRTRRGEAMTSQHGFPDRVRTR
jgi:hypothetical protein